MVRKQPLLTKTLLMAIAFSLLACAKDEPHANFKPLYFDKKSESTHFQFYYDDGLTAEQVKPIENALEDSYDAILDHLAPGPMPKIKIAIWSDKNQWEADMNHQFPGAAGYVYGKEEVRLLYDTSPGMLRGAVHEFVHVVTLFLSEKFSNNPRWLWEAVAQYESGSKTDLKQLPYIVSGDFPSLEELSNEQGGYQRIYPLGYSIGEYIVATWGYEGLRKLIRSHGNIEETLGISQADFENGWHAFVEERYLQ